MQNFIHHVPATMLKASWQAAVLIVLVLATQWVFGRRLGPRWRYLLWLLVMIRLALPLEFQARISLFNLVNLRGMTASVAGDQAAADGGDSVVEKSAPGTSKSRLKAASTGRPGGWGRKFDSNMSWFLWAWLAGAMTLSACLLVTQIRLSRRVARLRSLDDLPLLKLLEDCKQEMRVSSQVSLLETNEVGSPSLFGISRPRLLLPYGLARSFSLEELRFVFLHELGHIKRRDILAGWFATGLQILHWFNPLVWIAFHRMRADREMACDALALSYVREDENRQYGNTILKLLESFGRSAWAPSMAGAVESKKQLKERIQMIAKFKKTNHVPAFAVLMFAGLGLTTLTDAQSGGTDNSKSLVGNWVWVGAPGEVGEAPAAGGRFKLVTDRTWAVTQADPQTGEVLFHHGGTYALNGKKYAETVSYADASTSNLVGKTFKFEIKQDGDTLNLIGIENPWKEVWKRAKPDAEKPRKTDAAMLQGNWRGREIGGRADGTSSLAVQGSNLEFHGADSNEWYKATIATYDTTPKQIVVVITACPFQQYVGATSYAIFEIKDGTLTISGNEPGFPAAPTGFDAAGARKMVFKKE
jgi:beta-lactamase regulating signal transducer with metallopeptidase domain